jgi:hypothetical protein
MRRVRYENDPRGGVRKTTGGKWVEVCPQCGCPAVSTGLMAGNVDTVWAYQVLDHWIEEARMYRLICEDNLPREVIDAARSAHYARHGTLNVEAWRKATRAEDHPEYYDEGDADLREAEG